MRTPAGANDTGRDAGSMPTEDIVFGDPHGEEASMDQEGLEGLDSFTLARIVLLEAKRRAALPPMTPPPAPTARDLQEADQARAVQAAWEAGWKAGRSAGWQEGWDLRSAVDVVVWYVNSRVDL
jgi:hypothetical protein